MQAIERYKNGDVYIVVRLQFTTGANAEIYDLVFCAIPNRSPHLKRPLDGAEILDRHLGSGTDHWDQSCVRCVTELVQGPEEIIPSFVWLERFKERDNFRAEILATSPNIVIHISDGIAKREFGTLGIGVSIQNGTCESGLIEGCPKVAESIGGVIGANIGDGFSEFELVELCRSVTIKFDDWNIWLFLKEGIQPPLQVRDVFLSLVEA